MIEVLKYMEFFVDHFQPLGTSLTLTIDEDSSQTSFFVDTDPHGTDVMSLQQVLEGNENFLVVLAELWKHQNYTLHELPKSVSNFLKENREELKRPEMKLRTILDYVYTIV